MEAYQDASVHEKFLGGGGDFDIEVGSSAEEAASTTRAQVEWPSPLGLLLNILLYLCTGLLLLPFSFYTVDPQQHALVLFWGSLVRVTKQPGLHWYPLFGRWVTHIPTGVQTLDIKKSTVVDRNGNPIVVAAVVTFQVVDSVRAAFDVRGYADYLERQSLAVLKRVCSMYPYECKSGKSLQSESAEVSSIMVRLLQEKANVAGCRIVSYELADLQYAPEIAPGMLVRQQAEALVDARHTIVDGAVQIVTSAVAKLAENGVHLNDAQQARLVSNLLAVICGDAHVTPTFSVSEGNEEDKEEEEQFRKQMSSLLSQIALNTTPRK